MTPMNRTEEKLAELNQPKPWSGINAYRADPLLVDLSSGLSRSVREEYDVIGKYVTSHEAQELARMANQSPPQQPPESEVSVECKHPWAVSSTRPPPSAATCRHRNNAQAGRLSTEKRPRRDEG